MCFSEVAPHVLSLPHLSASQGWGSESLWSCSSMPASKPSGGSCLTTSVYGKCHFQVAHGPHRPAMFQTTYYIRAILLQLRALTFQSTPPSTESRCSLEEAPACPKKLHTGPQTHHEKELSDLFFLILTLSSCSLWLDLDQEFSQQLF